MESTIIKNLIEKSNIIYDELYNSEDPNVWEKESEAAEKFDSLMKRNFAFKLLVSIVVQERGDFFSSDREAAAFYLAYLEIKDQYKKNGGK